ncbi:MAG: ribosome small subunit-dependent GTPase A [Eubacterium sp.]|nr:ribosome small subunit-dependent GTPase A [Eubacterium sp.]
MKGLIVKGIAGFYYVRNDQGEVIQCKARGNFKNEGIVPHVGDLVEYQQLEDGDGIVEEIFPRKNQFIRPPIANVDLIVIVVAASKPKPNPFIIDRFLVMAERSNTDIVLCLNKVDDAKQKDIDAFDQIYDNIYKVIKTSAENGEGLEELKEVLKGRKTAFAGPSGVGKSTLINALQPGFKLETGEISNKTKRGKHTTRHVEIFEMDFGAMVYDTPGFTSFELLEANEAELQLFYPELAKFKGQCRYDDCVHIKEPECKVLEALERGEIHPSRYESYKGQIEEIRNKRKYK